MKSLSLAFLFMVADLPCASAAPKPDRATIQGHWEIVSISGGWKPKSVAGLHVVITGEQIKFFYGKLRAFTMAYKADPSQAPKTLDMFRQENGKTITQLGTYQLTGDTLKVCVESAGKPRPPKPFLGDGASATSWVFRRQKAVTAAR